jgi:hypothetical protein
MVLLWAMIKLVKVIDSCRVFSLSMRTLSLVRGFLCSALDWESVFDSPVRLGKAQPVRNKTTSKTKNNFLLIISTDALTL